MSEGCVGVILSNVLGDRLRKDLRKGRGRGGRQVCRDDVSGSTQGSCFVTARLMCRRSHDDHQLATEAGRVWEKQKRAGTGDLDRGLRLAGVKR
jgi:hypothetical protein